MKRLTAIVAETFLLLRRDKVFLPVATIMISAMALAHLASFWGTEEYKKILYDVGTSGIDLCGALVAIFWGTKLIADSKKEGSLELQLAAPVSRPFWIVGRFIGLASTLVFIGMLMIILWQIFLLINTMGWMEPKHLVIFGVQTLGWMVLAAISVCFASLGTQTTAMFCCLSLWVLGLVTANIAATLNKETPEWLKLSAKTAAQYWDFQRFNLSSYASRIDFPEDVAMRIIYGVILILLFVSFAAISFTRKDVATQ